MPTGCPETTWLSNEEYLRRFNEIAFDSKIPLCGGLELTHRCNLRCLHCYYGGYTDNLFYKEMPTKTILSLIDDITDAGCLYFLITGGELKI